jgi:hypothetical protein
MGRFCIHDIRISSSSRSLLLWPHIVRCACVRFPSANGDLGEYCRDGYVIIACSLYAAPVDDIHTLMLVIDIECLFQIPCAIR